MNTYNVEILNYFNPGLQFKDTESTTRNKLNDLLTELKRFKFVKTFVLDFKEIESGDETKYSTFYLFSKAESNMNKSDIDCVLKLIYDYIKVTKFAWIKFMLNYRLSYRSHY